MKAWWCLGVCEENTGYVQPASLRLCGLWHRFHGHAQAERFQAGDEPALESNRVPLVEVVVTQVAVGGAVLQDMVGDHQYAVPHRHGGLLLAPAPDQAAVLGGEVARGVAGGPGGLDEGCPEPPAPLPGLPGAPLPRALVVAGAEARPGGAVAVGGEDAHIGPQFRDQDLGRALLDPGGTPEPVGR